ncbi:site-specific integrase (plasmid) [Komagataeibacter nataicola]|uniref:site-specific integrase n=1 Tax=Komagataeibacter nataicola TaxID=265960 RepID=UPI0023DCEC4F|nr:site-specific integrase [Komagataeibacter nataicola]WEQ54363.1 site-specific integrase [Komagataeibacter nataicola]
MIIDPNGIGPAGRDTSLAAPLAQARAYARASRAPATRLAYRRDWAAFTAWCHERDQGALPADPRLVALFLAHEAARGLRPASIGRRLAAIAFAHRQAGCVPPQAQPLAGVLAEVVAGIRRQAGTAPRRKQAADDRVLQAMLAALPATNLKAIRDRALLAFGMAGAFRRSELAGLRCDQLDRTPEGMTVCFGVTKTDPEGRGVCIAIPEGRRIRPVALLDAWLEAAGITDGAVFRDVVRGQATAGPISDRTVARVVQRAARAAGYDPARFGGHSLRAGFLTSGARAGASLFRLKDVSRHRSTDVLAAYVREAGLFTDHAGEGFL